MTNQHSEEHQGAIKHSFLVTPFEHVSYKVHVFYPGTVSAFPTSTYHLFQAIAEAS